MNQLTAKIRVPVLALIGYIIGHAAIWPYARIGAAPVDSVSVLAGPFFSQLAVPFLAAVPALIAYARERQDLAWGVLGAILLTSQLVPALWVYGLITVATLVIAAMPGTDPRGAASVHDRTRLAGIVVLLYAVACVVPAVYFDFKTPNHGDNWGSGTGSPTGFACLLFGWLDPKYVIAWAANIPFFGALVSLGFNRGRPAYLAAALASLMALSTAYCLSVDYSRANPHPLAGCFLWQAAMLVLLFGVRLLYAQRDRVVVPVTIVAVALGAYFGFVPRTPLQMPRASTPLVAKRERSVDLLVKGTLVLPAGVDPEDVQGEVVLPSTGTMDWRKAAGRFLMPKRDGHVSLNVTLSLGERPHNADVMFRAPSAGKVELKGLASFTGDAKSGFVLDLGTVTLPALGLKPIQGPATFTHPGLPYAVDVPAGWTLTPADQGLTVTLDKGPSESVTVEAATWDRIQAAKLACRKPFPYPAQHKQVSQSTLKFGKLPRYDAYRDSDIRDLDRLRSTEAWQLNGQFMDTVDDVVTTLYGRLAFLSIRGEAHGKSQAEADGAFVDVMKVVDSVHAHAP